MKKAIPLIIVGMGILIIFCLFKIGTINNQPFLGGGIEGTGTYIASSTTTYISKTPAILHRLIVGKDEQTATISIYDADTSTGTAMMIFTGDTLSDVYDIGIYFIDGITVVTSQSDVTVIHSPR